MTVKTPIVKLNRDELWNLRLLDIEACGWVRRYIEKTRELRRVLLADPRKEHERRDLIAQDMELCRAFCDYVETVRKLTGYDKVRQRR